MRLDQLARAIEVVGVILPQFTKVAAPRREILVKAAARVEQIHQRGPCVSGVGPGGRLDLAMLGEIDIDMSDEAGLGREVTRLAGHAVVKPRCHGNQEIAIFHGVIRIGGAMHAEHVKGQRIGRIHGADTH